MSSEGPERAVVVSECLTVAQGWRSCSWRKDDYRNAAAGFWQLILGRIPGEILKVKSHLTKAQAAAVGLEESLRRDNELVDGVAVGSAEEAHV